MLVRFFLLCSLCTFSSSYKDDSSASKSSESGSGESEEFSVRDVDGFGAANKTAVPGRPCSHLELNTIFITKSRCGVFFVCQPYQGYINLFQYICPKDQVFDHSILQCNAELTCDMLVNIFQPEYPVCPAKSVYYDPVQPVKVIIHDPGEAYCGAYLVCEGGAVIMNQCEHDKVYNETTFLCEPTLSCDTAFNNVPISCEDIFEIGLWHRDPENRNKAWYCKRNRERENDYVTTFQYCLPGYEVKTEVSYRFECVQGPSTALSQNHHYMCDEVGNYVDSKSCWDFWHCHENLDGLLVAHLVKCPKGSYFDPEKESCTLGVCPFKKFSDKMPMKEIEDTNATCEKVPAKWSCEKDGAYYLHPRECSKYYQCNMSGTKPPCISQILECPPKQVYDPQAKSCLFGRCPKLNPIVPSGSGWRCTYEGETHPVPGQGKDCPKFYICTRCIDAPYWCYKVASCPEGQMFDDAMEKCQPSKICPQVPHPPSGRLKCERRRKNKVNPFDCSKYYACEFGKAATDITVIDYTCPPYEFYDDHLKTCVIGKCPQCYDPVPNDLDCPEHGAKISYPGSCTQYVKCMYVKKCTQKGRGPYWGHILVSCDEGEYFDDKKKRCTPGSCKRPPKDLEKGMECSVEGETKVHPNRCYEYYKCVYWSQTQSWGYHPSYCPPGKTYNVAKQACETGRCPQWKSRELTTTKRTPSLRVVQHRIILGMSCSSENERNVFPHTENQCNQYYECFRCGADWCYNSVTCPLGQFYDAKLKGCKSGKECPNSLLPRECTFIGERFPFNDDCTKYYKCDTCKSENCTPGQLVSELVTCPEGESFKAYLHRCRPGPCLGIRSDAVCSFKGESFPHPTDCTQYYRCEKCRGKTKSCKYSPQLKSCPTGETYNVKTSTCQSGACGESPVTVIVPPSHSPTPPVILTTTSFSIVHLVRSLPSIESTTSVPVVPTTVATLKALAVQTLSSTTLAPITTSEKCLFNGQVFSFPGDCTKYVKCQPCSGYGCRIKDKLVLYVMSCPIGQSFDPKHYICRTGACDNSRSVNITCSYEGERHYSPEAGCNQYYECILCKQQGEEEWCFDHFTCPSGYLYDERKRTCKKIGICPNQNPTSQSLVNCTKPKELLPFPTDCSKYYICQPCTEPHCFAAFLPELLDCSPGTTFNPQFKTCVEGIGSYCALSDIKCSFDGEKKLVPGTEKACNHYYSCSKCPDKEGLCMKQYKCKVGRYFDFSSKKCVKLEKCPVPGETLFRSSTLRGENNSSSDLNQTCSKEGIKIPNPSDCTKYLQCQEDEEEKYTLKEKQCKQGRYFHLFEGKCVPGECPMTSFGKPDIDKKELKCNGTEMKVGDLSKCDEFWHCTPDLLKPKKKRCTKGSFFHRSKLKCKAGTCPY